MEHTAQNQPVLGPFRALAPAAVPLGHIHALAGLPAARHPPPSCQAASRGGGGEVSSLAAPSPWRSTHSDERGWMAAVLPISRAQIYSLRPGEMTPLLLAPHQ